MPDGSVIPTGVALIAVAIITCLQVVLVIVAQGIMLERKNRSEAKVRQEERQEDYARQDMVAERAVEAARQLKISTMYSAEKLAKETKDANQVITEHLVVITDQAKKIHILVNSDMTAALTNERDQTRLTLLALKRVQTLSLSHGRDSTEEEEDAITKATNRVLELDQVLSDRRQAQLKLEAAELEEVSRKLPPPAPSPS